MAVEVPDSWGLTGKVAIVTGGGAAGDGIGNGRAAAILLARVGAQVVVVDRDEALAQRTVTMIAEDGGTAMAVQADVTRAADCAAIVQTVRLIRSKGVGVFFVTQTPKDVPADVLGQLGSRIQHALRAFTPDDAKALVHLGQSIVMVSFPVEVWKQPRVLDSGASYIELIKEPVV